MIYLRVYHSKDSNKADVFFDVSKKLLDLAIFGFNAVYTAKANHNIWVNRYLVLSTSFAVC